MSNTSLLPALESTFRRIPAASPVHAAAAQLLAVVLPPYIAHLSRRHLPPVPAPEQLPAARAEVACVLCTLRKFGAHCGSGNGLSGPDRSAAAAVAACMVEMLGAVVDDAAGAMAAAAAAGVADGEDDVIGDMSLVTLTAAQLVPGAQVGGEIRVSSRRVVSFACVARAGVGVCWKWTLLLASLLDWFLPLRTYNQCQLHRTRPSRSTHTQVPSAPHVASPFALHLPATQFCRMHLFAPTLDPHRHPCNPTLLHSRRSSPASWTPPPARAWRPSWQPLSGVQLP